MPLAPAGYILVRRRNLVHQILPPVIRRGLQSKRQPAGGALAQFPQEAAILPKVHPEHLRHGEDPLPVRDGAMTSSATQLPNCSTCFWWQDGQKYLP